MAAMVELSDGLYGKLQALGGQLFTVPEVIERLAEGHISGPPLKPMPAGLTSPERATDLGALRMRAPRERGATVVIEGQLIHAGTVSDLYEQVFRHLLNNGKADALKQLAPYRTSNQRYLFAREPKHPNGNDFFVDVKVGPYHIEAHKNYEQAIKQLAELLRRIGVAFRYSS